MRNVVRLLAPFVRFVHLTSFYLFLQERGFTSGTKASGGAASRPNVAGSFAGMGGAAKKGAGGMN